MIDTFHGSLYKSIKESYDQLKQAESSNPELIVSCLTKLRLKINNFDSLPSNYGLKILSNYFDTLCINPKGKKLIARLCALLESDPHRVGQTIISNYQRFKGYAVSIFNRLTQSQDIKYGLSNVGI